MLADRAVIAAKLASALIPGAEPTPLAARFSGHGGRLVFDWVKRSTGGLWVGGRLVLTPAELIFTPNALNRAVHVAVAARGVPLERVVRVNDRFGLLTRIVDVELEDGALFTFRCFGARAFADKIAAAAAAAARREEA